MGKGISIFREFPQGIPTFSINTAYAKSMQHQIDAEPKQTLQCCAINCKHEGPFELGRKMYCYAHLSQHIKETKRD